MDKCGRFFLALGLSAAFSGCGDIFGSDDAQPTGPYLSDNGDWEAIPGMPGDHLSSAYALGTVITVNGNPLGANPGAYDIRSDDPAVLEPGPRKVDGAILHVDFRARAEGQTVLSLIAPDGAVVRRATAIVRRADRVRIYESGAARVHGLGQAMRALSEVSQPQVLVGGKLVVGVAYFRQAEHLSGSGEALVTAPPGLAIEQLAFGGPVNTVLTASPMGTGAQRALLAVAGVPIGALDVEGVDGAAVASLTLEPEDRAASADGDEVWVRALAHDAAGQPIYGADADFSLDGVLQKGDPSWKEPIARGDLYRYKYAKGGAPRTLEARFAATSATLPIPAHDGYVSDSTYLGCSTAPGRQGGSVALLGLAFATLALLRRRCAG